MPYNQRPTRLGSPPIKHALTRFKLHGAKVDLLTNSNLVETASKAEKAYDNVLKTQEKVSEELQAEVNDFLGIDFQFIKDKAIPFAKRLPIVQNIAGKISSIISKADPILKGIQEVRSTIDGIANGSNFTEGVNDLKAAQPIEDATKALGVVDEHFADIEKQLAEVAEHGARLAALQGGALSAFADDPSISSFTDEKAQPPVTADNLSEENFLPIIMGAIGAASSIVDIINKIRR